MCFTYDAIKIKSPPNNYTLKYFSELNQVSYSLPSFLNEKLAYEVAILTARACFVCVCTCKCACICLYCVPSGNCVVPLCLRIVNIFRSYVTEFLCDVSFDHLSEVK
jgi:hypothetical protein